MNEPKELEGWISTAQAAEISGYSQEYIRQLARDKESGVVSTKIGVHVLINRQSLEEYVKKTRVN